MNYLPFYGRGLIFVVEQTCPYPEIDEVDNNELTQHVFLFKDQQVAAYARCYKKNEQFSAFGRVLVAEQFRGEGLAKNWCKLR